MPGKLAAALAWAARGFRVFPVNAETRGGPGEYPLGAGWTEYATTEPDAIARMWTDPVLGAERDYNIGCLANDVVIIDVDVKQGKPGLKTFIDLGLSFDTLTVRTTTGGYHVYFASPGRAVGASPLGPGLDIRSWHGYVLAPGSTLGGVPYEIELDLPLAQLPAGIVGLLRAPHERSTNVNLTNVELDTPAAIQFATSYLNNAPIAVEGMNGDDTTYRVACKVRDFGISEVECWALMLDEWNDRCSPPWTPDELEGKVHNAYAYATGTAGQSSPAVVFEGVILPAVVPAVPDVPIEIFEPGRAIAGNRLLPRPWVMNRLLIRRAVTTLIATGSAGKSTLILTVAAHLALGKDFLGFKCKVGPSASIVYNAEDDLEEMSRRLHSICQIYSFDFETVSSKVIIVTSEDISLLLTTGNPPTINESHVGALLTAAAKHQVAMIGLDPLVEVHTALESDNTQMRYVMSVARFIARRANVPVMFGHHTKKPLTAGAGYSGDADASRGASAIINSSRIALTMSPVDMKTDGERYGISETDRSKYVRLDDAKMNLTLAGGKPVWLRREGVKLYNGDEVGTLVLADLEENMQGAARLMARVFHAEMSAKARASIDLPEAVDLLRGADPLYTQLTTARIRNRIERYLGTAVELEGGHRIKLHHQAKGTGQIVTIVLE